MCKSKSLTLKIMKCGKRKQKAQTLRLLRFNALIKAIKYFNHAPPPLQQISVVCVCDFAFTLHSSLHFCPFGATVHTL